MGWARRTCPVRIRVGCQYSTADYMKAASLYLKTPPCFTPGGRLLQFVKTVDADGWIRSSGQAGRQ